MSSSHAIETERPTGELVMVMVIVMPWFVGSTSTWVPSLRSVRVAEPVRSLAVKMFMSYSSMLSDVKPSASMRQHAFSLWSGVWYSQPGIAPTQ